MSSIFACDVGLNRKTLPRNFFCCFVFHFGEIFFNQPWRQIRALLILLFGKNKRIFLERTPPGKKLHFCIRCLWKMKEIPANLNRGVCFSLKWKATCKYSHLPAYSVYMQHKYHNWPKCEYQVNSEIFCICISPRFIL